MLLNNKELVFTGPFKDLIPKYIKYKQNMGYAYNYDYSKRLKQMDNFFKKYTKKDNILTKKMVLDFVKKRDNETNSTICIRCALIRGFAKFLKELGCENVYILPSQYIPKQQTNFIPHIFSHDEMDKLFNIIDNFHFGSNYLNEHNIYSVLIRLLYSCGLRISEALSLKVSDINFTNSIIQVLHSKNNCSRIVVISDSISKILKEYINKENLTNESLIFSSPCGNKYSQSAVLRMFKQFFKKANIYTNDSKLPRIHDFRHTFSVHSLQKMIDSGTDIYCALPFLSSYLGHTNIYSTEKYVRLVEECFEELRNANSNIFPEVNQP